VASGSSDRTIKSWNLSDGSVVREYANPNLKTSGPNPVPAVAHPGWVYGLRFTPDGRYLVSIGGAPQNKGFLGVWSTADGRLVSGEEMPLGSFYAVALSADGKLLALGTGSQGRPVQDMNSSFVLKMPDAVK